MCIPWESDSHALNLATTGLQSRVPYKRVSPLCAKQRFRTTTIKLQWKNFESSLTRSLEMQCPEHHKNLVRLVGYCCESEHGMHGMLVYEFMVSGSVKKYVEDEDGGGEFMKSRRERSYVET